MYSQERSKWFNYKKHIKGDIVEVYDPKNEIYYFRPLTNKEQSKIALDNSSE